MKGEGARLVPKAVWCKGPTAAWKANKGRRDETWRKKFIADPSAERLQDNQCFSIRASKAARYSATRVASGLLRQSTGTQKWALAQYNRLQMSVLSRGQRVCNW